MATNYTYNIPDQDPWADRNPRTKEDVAFDKLDATGVLHVVQRAMASEEEKVRVEQFHKDVATFRVMYPAYKDSDHNSHAMKHHWEHVLGVTIPSLEQIEECFFELRNSAVIQLDAKAVAKENQEAIIRRAAEIREKREAEAFNEDSAYGMDMADLEARCRGWK
jgi:hypothetical protein